jgi:hypothetical protein
VEAGVGKRAPGSEFLPNWEWCRLASHSLVGPFEGSLEASSGNSPQNLTWCWSNVFLQLAGPLLFLQESSPGNSWVDIPENVDRLDPFQTLDLQYH